MAIRERKKRRDGFMNLVGGVDSNLNPNLLQANQLSFAINVSLRGGYADNRPGYKERSLIFDTSEEQTWFETKNLQGAITYRPRKGHTVVVCSVGGRIFKISPIDDYKVTDITPVRATETTTQFISPAIDSTVTVDVEEPERVFVNYPVTIGTGKYVVTAKDGHTLTIKNLTTVPGETTAIGSLAYYQDPNSDTLFRAWFVQAEKWLVIQNGRHLPIIYDGNTTRRATRDPAEIPVGTVMAYSQGRIWLATSPTEFIAGDIVNGPSAEERDKSVLRVSENNLLRGGGSFKVPDSAGSITAMIVMSQLDTTLGQGPLQVLTENSIFSVNAPANREAWSTLTDPIQTVSLINYGAASHYGAVVVNGDLFFRSRDGIRSFVMARRDFGTWGNTPISTEVNRVLRGDESSLLQYTSAVLFDNRLLFTVRPIKEDSRCAVYTCGMVSLNFDPVSSMTVKTNPIWEGLWTGINPYLLVTGLFDGEDRCFCFARNQTDTNMEFWEITKDDEFDGDSGRIQSVIETASFVYQNAFEMNKLNQAEAWVDRIVGTVDFNLKFKPDQYPCWFDWPNDIQVCSKYKECDQSLDDCLISHTFGDGYRTRIRWGQPPELAENFDNKPISHFYEMQARLQWTGRARIKAMMFKAYEVVEDKHAGDLS